MEFIYRGAVQFGEPGVFITFEEKREDLIKNVASLGFDLVDLEKRNLLVIDYVKVERNEIEETGSFNLDGLFVRIGYAIDSIGAKRVVLDTIESLFAGISNHSILRAEIRRLFNWLRDKEVTVIITGEQGGGDSITRQGLEEYVSDCVIFLDHRINEQYGTRRIRIIKYRGSIHGTNEYPFIITESGISILPISTVRLDSKSTHERISTGIAGIDDMLGGKGFFRGSTILVSGTAGTGKTSVLAHRLVDFLKEKNITCIMSNLTSTEGSLEKTDVAISSLVDTWILLKELENNSERNRSISILKSRGMKHSNQVRELIISDQGIETKSRQNHSGNKIVSKG